MKKVTNLKSCGHRRRSTPLVPVKTTAEATHELRVSQDLRFLVRSQFDGFVLTIFPCKPPTVSPRRCFPTREPSDALPLKGLVSGGLEHKRHRRLGRPWPFEDFWSVVAVGYTLPRTNMEVENHLFVVDNGLPRAHSPLPC